jgi:hypothetical protein
MKANRLLLLATVLFLTTTIQAQEQEDVRGIKWNETTTILDLVTINPENPNQILKTTNIPLYNDKRYMPNTMSYIPETNRLYFFTQSNSGFKQGRTTNQQFEVANLETGGIFKSIPIHNTTLIAPFMIPNKNQLGFIATERTFNNYGNNDDNIALVIFDMNSGEMAHRIVLPSLSLSATSTPFVGTVDTKTINGNVTTGTTDISVSSPCYITSTNTLLLSAKDVLGVTRLYRFDLTDGRLVSKLSLGVDVLDMTYDETNEVVRAVYVNTVEDKKSLYAGDLDLTNNDFSNIVLIRDFSPSEKEIKDGEIEVDQSTGLITVVKLHANNQVYYTFDEEWNLLSEKLRYVTTGNIDIEFPTPLVPVKRIDFENLITIFPNPASDMLTVETMDVTTVNRITVFDNLGQEVKDVDVQSGTLSNSVDISNLKPGIYMVKIQSTGVSDVTKKLVVQ